MPWEHMIALSPAGGADSRQSKCRVWTREKQVTLARGPTDRVTVTSARDGMWCRSRWNHLVNPLRVTRALGHRWAESTHSAQERSQGQRCSGGTCWLVDKVRLALGLSRQPPFQSNNYIEVWWARWREGYPRGRVGYGLRGHHYCHPWDSSVLQTKSIASCHVMKTFFLLNKCSERFSKYSIKFLVLLSYVKKVVIKHFKETLHWKSN